MANILYTYPQSNCNCYQCDKKIYPTNQGSITNFSVHGCRVSDGFECYDRKVFQQNTQPQGVDDESDVSLDVDKYTFLNKLSSNLSNGFYSIDCPSESSCPATTYVSSDPRLLDPVRNSRLHLDRPPMTGDMASKDVYSDKFKNYGKGYHTYSDINAGQIQYYINDSIKDALYRPVYDIPAEVSSLFYQDPMSNMKQQYVRNTGNITDAKKVPSYSDNYGCLSFTDDTSNHREDIISRQQSKNNQQKWSARWGNQ